MQVIDEIIANNELIARYVKVALDAKLTNKLVELEVTDNILSLCKRLAIMSTWTHQYSMGLILWVSCAPIARATLDVDIASKLPSNEDMIDKTAVNLYPGALTYDVAKTIVDATRTAIVQMLKIIMIDNSNQQDALVEMKVDMAVLVKCLDTIFVPFCDSLVQVEYVSVANMFRESDDGIQAILKKMDVSDVNDPSTQRDLIVLAYREFEKKQARIFDDMVYLPVYTPAPNRRFTRAFKRHRDVASMVPTFFNTMHNTDMLKSIMKNPSVLPKASAFILSHRDPYMLPTLKTYRGSWSFRDGIYDGNTGKFYSYSDELCPIACTMKYINQSVADLFVGELDSVPHERRRFPVHEVKYHRESTFAINKADIVDDFSYEHLPSFMHIETPAFDKITHLQFFNASQSEDDMQAYMFFLAMLGRLFFQPTSDGFQIIPFLIGAGGTGKSLILSTIRAAFEADLVGDIGPNIEPTFGLQSLYQKHIIICSETSRDGGLDFPTFKQMVSNDMMTVNRKNHTTVTLDQWDISMIWSMNELPKYRSDAGALERRIAAFCFANQPSKSDVELEKNIQDELARIIVKLCEARSWLYERMIDNRMSSVHDAMPILVSRFTNEMMTKLDLCIQFLRAGRLEKRPGSTLYWRDIMEEFKKWGSTYGVKKFDDMDLTMQTHLRKAGFKIVRIERTDTPFGGVDMIVNDIAVAGI
jgi:hypothetical protein